MTPLVLQAAGLCAVTGVLAGTAVVARTRHLRRGVSVLLDFLLAAGLLRLSVTESWSALVTAAGIVLVRTAVMQVGLRAVPPDRGQGARGEPHGTGAA